MILKPFEGQHLWRRKRATLNSCPPPQHKTPVTEEATGADTKDLVARTWCKTPGTRSYTGTNTLAKTAVSTMESKAVRQGRLRGHDHRARVSVASEEKMGRMGRCLHLQDSLLTCVIDERRPISAICRTPAPQTALYYRLRGSFQRWPSSAANQGNSIICPDRLVPSVEGNKVRWIRDDEGRAAETPHTR